MKLEQLDALLGDGKWRRAVKYADSILKANSLQLFDGERRRYSFMNGDSYTLYTVLHPDEDISWVRNHASVMFAKAYALSEMKKYDEAAKTLEAVLEWDPVTPRTYFELCSDYIKLHRFKEAAELLERAQQYVMSIHDVAVLYQKRGFLFSQSGDFERARLYTLYSLLFERREAAVRELSYIDSKTGGSTTDYENTELLKAAAQELEGTGEAFHLSDEAFTALKKLQTLYTMGCDEEKASYYTEQLKGFAERQAGADA